jgi:curved DNA-binding protein CbpA
MKNGVFEAVEISNRIYHISNTKTTMMRREDREPTTGMAPEMRRHELFQAVEHDRNGDTSTNNNSNVKTTCGEMLLSEAIYAQVLKSKLDLFDSLQEKTPIRARIAKNVSHDEPDDDDLRMLDIEDNDNGESKPRTGSKLRHHTQRDGSAADDDDDTEDSDIIYGDADKEDGGNRSSVALHHATSTHTYLPETRTGFGSRLSTIISTGDTSEQSLNTAYQDSMISGDGHGDGDDGDGELSKLVRGRPSALLTGIETGETCSTSASHSVTSHTSSSSPEKDHPHPFMLVADQAKAEEVYTSMMANINDGVPLHMNHQQAMDISPGDVHVPVQAGGAPPQLQSYYHHSELPLDPYDILQIPFAAVASEVRQAYTRAALVSHPARVKRNFVGRGGNCNSDQQSTTAAVVDNQYMFALLAAAFETLSDKATRQSYDCEFYTQTPVNAVGVSPRKTISMSRQRSLLSSSSNIQEYNQYRERGADWNFDHVPKPSAVRSSPRKSARGVPQPLSILRKAPLHPTHNQTSTGNGTSTHASSSCNNNNSLLDKEHLYSYQGPLSDMYKARKYAPFLDPYQLFNDTMGSNLFPNEQRVQELQQHEGEKKKNTAGMDTDPVPSSLLAESRFVGASTTDSSAKRSFAFSRMLTCGAVEGEHGEESPSSPPKNRSFKNMIRCNHDTTTADDEDDDGTLLCGSPGGNNNTTSSLAHNTITHKPCWKGTAIAAPNGQRRISRTTRILQGGASRVTKTEITSLNPTTGKCKTSVKVVRHDSVTELDEDDLEFERLYQELEDERRNASLAGSGSGANNHTSFDKSAAGTRRRKRRGGRFLLCGLGGGGIVGGGGGSHSTLSSSHSHSRGTTVVSGMLEDCVNLMAAISCGTIGGAR